MSQVTLSLYVLGHSLNELGLITELDHNLELVYSLNELGHSFNELVYSLNELGHSFNELVYSLKELGHSFNELV